MKDWKAEYDKLRGELAEVRKQLDYECRMREERYDRSERIQNAFKELLIEVLGK